MRNGFRIVDIDTHVNPTFDTLAKYVDPAFRARLEEFTPYLRIGRVGGADNVNMLTVKPVSFDRFPGEAEGGTAPATGHREAASARSRVRPAKGVQDEDAAARLKDMDLEGRDLDFLIPGNWATAATGLPDVTLCEGLYRAYHNYIAAYCQQDVARLRSMLLVPGADVEWAVAEVKRLAGEKWVAAVWPMLPQDMPIDHPGLDPLWAVMNEAHLPIVFHSFFGMPPYFPGYRDIWGNACVARTAAHPWAAARLLAYLIVGRVFDRFPNLNAGVAEVGHGWVPHWLIRLGEMTKYVLGSTPKLAYEPIEYARMGRFRCGAEPMEGAAMTKAVIDLLGPDTLMHQSDYPHGEAYFPETAQIVMDWPFWKDLGPDALRKHMSGNAERFLRLL